MTATAVTSVSMDLQQDRWVVAESTGRLRIDAAEFRTAGIELVDGA